MGGCITDRYDCGVFGNEGLATMHWFGVFFCFDTSGESGLDGFLCRLVMGWLWLWGKYVCTRGDGWVMERDDINVKNGDIGGYVHKSWLLSVLLSGRIHNTLYVSLKCVHAYMHLTSISLEL